MLCKKCGSYNPDGSEYCSLCKEPLQVRSSGSIRLKIDSEKLLLQIRSTFNERYFITRFIGEGTFAQVFYAIDKATNTGVAIKVFKPFIFKNEDEMSRLVWGIRGIKDISHPNLVRIFDADISVEGWVYVSMKFIYGMSLKNTIKLRTEVNKPFSFEEIEPLFFQMGEILNEMHPTICHGDFKPSNIIIQPDYIKLTDTTILNYIPLSNCLKQLKEDKSNIYLAPEIFEGNEPSYRSDIYSCGRILLTLLSGSEESDVNKAVLFKYNETIDKKLKDIIIKATNKDPLLRHNDINEFNAELFDALSIYNDLPQSIRDEYHQNISAVETKFTHIKKKMSETQVKSDDKVEKKSSKKGILSLIVIILFLSILITAALLLKDRFFAANMEKIPIILLLDTSKLEDIFDAAQETNISDVLEDTSIIEDVLDEDIVVREKVEQNRVLEIQEKKAVSRIEEKRVVESKTGKENEKIKEKSEKEEIEPKEKSKASGPCPKDMVYIPAGSFKMGSVPADEGRQPDELAFVSVSTHSYCIDRYEFPNKKGMIPKTSVSFDEADKLCGSIGKRLCSEEEWERACKGLSMLKYPYDNNFDPNACNAESDSGEDRNVAPSGKFSRCKSTYGIFDMSGNVAEWVYMKGGAKGVKGGYVNKPAWAVRCASRKVESGSKKSPYYGFRCCMDAEE